jgi:hypothetical protein
MCASIFAFPYENYITAPDQDQISVTPVSPGSPSSLAPVRCHKAPSAPLPLAFPLALIHRSARKVNSPKFVKKFQKIVHLGDVPKLTIIYGQSTNSMWE